MLRTVSACWWGLSGACVTVKSSIALFSGLREPSGLAIRPCPTLLTLFYFSEPSGVWEGTGWTLDTHTGLRRTVVARWTESRLHRTKIITLVAYRTGSAVITCLSPKIAVELAKRTGSQHPWCLSRLAPISARTQLGLLVNSVMVVACWNSVTRGSPSHCKAPGAWVAVCRRGHPSSTVGANWTFSALSSNTYTVIPRRTLLLAQHSSLT